eukprot:Nk52_evm15s503 gene=Nk52_evmTU15s503
MTGSLSNYASGHTALLRGALVFSTIIVTFPELVAARESHNSKSNNNAISEERAQSSDRINDNAWLMTSAFLVFTMQAGFGMLEAGMVRSRNSANIMMKNMADMSFGVLAYYCFGWGLSYGGGSNEFMGKSEFFLADGFNRYPDYVFQFAFAATAATIVSGCVAERCEFISYIVYSTVMTAFIYPIPVHWIWDDDGWLFKEGFLDFAGDSVVHCLGGMAGLIATYMMGPRIGRYTSEGEPIPVPMSSPTNAVLGMFLLWWGWFGFNSGSTLRLSDNGDILASKVALNTVIASGSSGSTGIIISYLYHKRHYVDVMESIGGVLAGLVAITAPCSVVSAEEAIVIGFVGSIICFYLTIYLAKWGIDDPVGAVPVHLGCGAWGIVAVGLFCRPEVNSGYTDQTGLFHGGGFKLLGVQVYGLLAILGWTAVFSTLLFKIIDLTMGMRVPASFEILGLDRVEHRIIEITLVTDDNEQEYSHEGVIRDGPESLFSDPPGQEPERRASRLVGKFGSIQNVQHPAAKRSNASSLNSTDEPNPDLAVADAKEAAREIGMMKIKSSANVLSLLSKDQAKAVQTVEDEREEKKGQISLTQKLFSLKAVGPLIGSHGSVHSRNSVADSSAKQSHVSVDMKDGPHENLRRESVQEDEEEPEAPPTDEQSDTGSTATRDKDEEKQ